MKYNKHNNNNNIFKIEYKIFNILIKINYNNKHNNNKK